MLWLVLAALGPVAILLRRLPVLTRVRTPIGYAADRLDTGGALTALVVFAASATIYGWSVWKLFDEGPGDERGWWEWVGVGLLLLATIAAFSYALFQRWRGKAQPVYAV
jgi:hypothetical protein